MTVKTGVSSINITIIGAGAQGYGGATYCRGMADRWGVAATINYCQ